MSFAVAILAKIDKQINIIREVKIETFLSERPIPTILYICTGKLRVSQPSNQKIKS